MSLSVPSDRNFLLAFVSCTYLHSAEETINPSDFTRIATFCFILSQ